MSVETEADKALGAAYRKLYEASMEMSKVLIARCWGHDKYNAEARELMREAFALTLKARDLMDMFRTCD